MIIISRDNLFLTDDATELADTIVDICNIVDVCNILKKKVIYKRSSYYIVKTFLAKWTRGTQ